MSNPFKFIKAFTAKKTGVHIEDYVTSTDANSKRGLDVAVISDISKTTDEKNLKSGLDILKSFLMGSLPDPDWDEMSYEQDTELRIVFSFKFKDVLVFDVVINNPLDAFVVTLDDHALFETEGGRDWLITEDNWNIEQEN